MEKKEIKFVLNGQPHTLEVSPWRTLLEMIREDLQLTGTKEGCGQGECGSCTVIMGGKTVNSCLVLAMEADGQEITTIEGLAKGEALHPIQESFVEHAGMQCGFCTPGMIMSAKALLDKNSSPSEKEIREGISGNFCRCTGYTKIIESISAAAVMMKGGK
ncbi:MAG: ferredoxin [Deltaproteobacteria bacterium HGW-Deltaproteobacteria-15]|jgi:carbon-monoxide dehydrogenase small subunit|nr:MAG: ferredoxin [Deltaproteobacteria bacterium HGW-Deltaproteobacteria-15]